MIDCTDKNIYYKRRKRSKSIRRFIAFFLVFIVVLSIFSYYRCVVAKRIFNICEEYSKTYASISVNNAIYNVLGNNIKYSDIINVEKNNNGDIVLMSANSLKVNLLTREIVDKTTNELTNRLTSGVPIPLLLFLGFDVAKGYGKIINYKSIFVSQVNCEFYSEFLTAGINQTIHKIYVNVVCLVNVSAFSSSVSQLIKTPVLISETVLVGKIPQTYLSGKLFGINE